MPKPVQLRRPWTSPGQHDHANELSVAGIVSTFYQNAAYRAMNRPGHPAVFRHAGRMWITWHGWRPSLDDPDRYRAMYTTPLVWDDGRPFVWLP